MHRQPLLRPRLTGFRSLFLRLLEAGEDLDPWGNVHASMMALENRQSAGEPGRLGLGPLRGRSLLLTPGRQEGWRRG